jgi:LPXTG-site transpeptidase (sortase) family protein
VKGVLATGIVLGSTFGIGYPLFWSHRSSSAGGALIAASDVGASAIGSVAPASCPKTIDAAAQPSPGKAGVLEIPSLNLTAPVLQGLGDDVLGVAAGHVPGTPWPGARGESMLLAHDVSYFSNISKLRAGDAVTWLTPCFKATFAVDAFSIMQPGQLVYPASNGTGLALVTCYPTDALFWTTKRYVVKTHLLSEQLTAETLPSTTAARLPAMSINAPSALARQGLTLESNSLALGTLSISGAPNEAFSQGPEPLAIEHDALEVFFAARKSVEQHQPTWWKDLTVAGLPMPASWPSFGVVNVNVSMAGTVPTSVTFSSGSTSATVILEYGVWYLASLSN